MKLERREEDGIEYHPVTEEAIFGPKEVYGDEKVSDQQWTFGANRLAHMACEAVDELSYQIVDDGFTVTNHKYSESRTEDQLWRALWMLERDIRVFHGEDRPFIGAWATDNYAMNEPKIEESPICWMGLWFFGSLSVVALAGLVTGHPQALWVFVLALFVSISCGDSDED